MQWSKEDKTILENLRKAELMEEYLPVIIWCTLALFIWDHKEDCSSHLIRKHWVRFISFTIDTLLGKSPSTCFNSSFIYAQVSYTDTCIEVLHLQKHSTSASKLLALERFNTSAFSHRLPVQLLLHPFLHICLLVYLRCGLRCLELQPQDRPPSRELLKHPVFRVLTW